MVEAALNLTSFDETTKILVVELAKDISARAALLDASKMKIIREAADQFLQTAALLAPVASDATVAQQLQEEAQLVISLISKKDKETRVLPVTHLLRTYVRPFSALSWLWVALRLPTHL